MENYDIIIIGGGIAGAGLAYNLNNINARKKVLLIDKSDLGSNKGYNYRLTFEDTIKEYDIKPINTYKGAKFFSDPDNELLSVDEPIFSFDYEKLCKILFKKSTYIFKKEIALKISQNKLMTNKQIYKFKYLIDCSGHNFFLRKKLKLRIPFNYFIGNIKILKAKSNLDKKYYHILAKNDGYVEEVYFANNKIIGGDWQITDKFNINNPNFNLIKRPKRRFYNEKIKDKKIINSKLIYYPISPSFPLVYKNYAFLGNSFGNAETSAGCGIDSTLKSSKLLATAINNKNLKSYEKKWKKENLNSYLYYLATKMKLNKRTKRLDILKSMNSHPKLFVQMFRNKKIELPYSIKKSVPLSFKLKSLYNYSILKMKYSIGSL